MFPVSPCSASLLATEHVSVCPTVHACRKLSDIDEDNSLSEEEFCIAMKLVVARRKGLIVPSMLPEVLRPHPPSGERQACQELQGSS